MASKKSPNFTELEKTVLIELVDSRNGIIESKQNDGKMISKRNKEWENIGKEFNSRHGVHKRSLTQLKSLWKNLKARTKSVVAKDRREQNKTGGGPADTRNSALLHILPLNFLNFISGCKLNILFVQ